MKGGRSQLDKSIDVKGKKKEVRAAPSSLLPVCLLKLRLSLRERGGSGEVCATQLRLSLSFSPRNYATFNQTAQKQTVKRIKSRDGNPFSIHYAQPVDRGGASLQFKYPPQTFCEQLLHFSIRNPHLSIRSNNLLRLDETLMIPVGRNGSMRRSGKVK